MMRRRSIFAALAGLCGGQVLPAGAAPAGEIVAVPVAPVADVPIALDYDGRLRADLRFFVSELRQLAEAAAQLDARQHASAEHCIEVVLGWRVPEAVAAEGYRPGGGFASLLRSAEAALARASSSAAISGDIPCTLSPSIPSASDARAASAAALGAGGPAYSAAVSAISTAASRDCSARSMSFDIESSMGLVGAPMVEAGGTDSQRSVPPAASARAIHDPVHVAQRAAPGTKLSRETLSRSGA